eukprot:TRINITY_DN9553_c0_g1_i1.p1 TRINITY_DN9553_c0_g1~~TRINITY_DN9553_c0_g1_i1.p1  ORF type:complete len:906 (-),score=252.76 TRINITY_DN9553_c0_g1_i1:154-2871(-)
MARDANVSALQALKLELEEKTEEARSWRIRCLQSEAEVRALKFRTRHTEPQAAPNASFEESGIGISRPSSIRGSRCDSSEELFSGLRTPRKSRASVTSSPEAKVRECGVQKDAESSGRTVELANLREELHRYEAMAAAERGQYEELATTEASKLGDAERHSELETLQQQIQQKNFTIVQLQADMVRDRQTLEKKKKDAESLNIFCKEELREMTQRAESLSEQVRKSKGKLAELQAAREENVRLHSNLEECQERYTAHMTSNEASLQALADEREAAASELATGRREFDAAVEQDSRLRAEVTSSNEELTAYRRRSATMDEEQQALEQKLAEASREVSEAKRQHSATMEESRTERRDGPDLSQDTTEFSRPARHQRSQSLAVLQTMRDEVQRELKSASSTGGGVATLSNDRMMQRLSRQLDRLQQLMADGSSGAGGMGSLAGRAGARAASPEGEHPPPEHQRTGSSGAAVTAECQQLQQEVHTLQQQLNDRKLTMELLREELRSEHCDDLDDLVKRHDQERRSLHSQLSELRAETAELRESGVAKRPMEEIREHFEQQMQVVKRDLVAQISDFHEIQRALRTEEDSQAERMRRSLDETKSECETAREEFRVLAGLFEKERAEKNQLNESCARLRSEAAAAAAAETASAQQAAGMPQGIVTITSSHDATPETTETWDTLHGPLSLGPGPDERHQHRAAAASERDREQRERERERPEATNGVSERQVLLQRHHSPPAQREGGRPAAPSSAVSAASANAGGAGSQDAGAPAPTSGRPVASCLGTPQRSQDEVKDVPAVARAPAAAAAAPAPAAATHVRSMGAATSRPSSACPSRPSSPTPATASNIRVALAAPPPQAPSSSGAPVTAAAAAAAASSAKAAAVAAAAAASAHLRMSRPYSVTHSPGPSTWS